MADTTAHRKTIVQALASLLDKKPLDDITTLEICREAGVSRQTFYRCFQNKYDAALWYPYQLINATCRNIGISCGWRDGYLSFFRLLSLDSRFHQAVISTRGAESLYGQTMRTSREDFATAYRRRYGHEPDELIAFQIRYFSKVSTMAIADWQAKEYSPDAETFVDRFLTLVPRELFEALDMEKSDIDAGWLMIKS